MVTRAATRRAGAPRRNLLGGEIVSLERAAGVTGMSSGIATGQGRGLWRFEAEIADFEGRSARLIARSGRSRGA